MTRNAVRRWVNTHAPLIDTVDAAIRVFSASCKVLAAMGPDDQVEATPGMLTRASEAMTATLDQLADAPRIPDLPLDMMMAGAIGKLRRCTGNPVTAHVLDTCADGCEHTEIEDWADETVRALQAWDRFKGELNQDTRRE